MEISNRHIWGAAAALALGIGIHQASIWWGGRPDPEPVRPIAPKAAAASARRPGAAASGGYQRGVEGPPSADSEVANPYESPGVRDRMVDEQAWRMEEYTKKAGEDDPFALTEEEIKEFRSRGDPVVW